MRFLLLCNLLLASLTTASTAAMPLPAMKIPKRLIVIAPHPDDVMLSAGLVHAVKAARGDVLLLDITSGDSSSKHGIDYVKRRGFRAHANPSMNYGLYRQKEETEAVKHLGLEPRREVTQLGYPDGGLWEILQRGPCLGDLNRGKCGNATLYLNRNTGVSAVPYPAALRPGAPYLAQAIVDDIASSLKTFKPDMVMTTHPNDIHPDHAAAYHLAILAMKQSGITPDKTPVFVPLDSYGTELPTKFMPGLSFTAPGNLPSPTRWFNHHLVLGAYQAKVKLVATYRSQMAWEHPIVDDYAGTDSYMYGYIGTNELFGSITTAKHDEDFRVSRERSTLLPRISAIARNAANDLLDLLR